MLRVYPRHWLDIALWPALTLAEKFSRVHSYPWQWRLYPGEMPAYFCEWVDPDPSGKFVAIFRPIHPLREERFYRIGFQRQGKNGVVRKFCTRLLKEECAVPLAPVPSNFFAIVYPGRMPIMLDLVRVTVISQLPSRTPLL